MSKVKDGVCVFSSLVNDCTHVNEKPWIGPTGAASVQHASGSYASVVTGTSLKIISLNTIYWYRNKWALTDVDLFH